MSTRQALLDIAVIGSGTAGTAAALFLSRAGHDVTVVERVPEPGPVGAGIVMQPSGLAMLRRLSLHEPILASGARLVGLTCRAPTHTLFQLRYERLQRGAFGLGLHRGVLFQALFGALRNSDVHLVVGKTAERLEAYGDRHFVRLAGTGRVGPFDLVIIADGARSTLRAQVAPHAMVRRYPFGALWFIGVLPPASPAARIDELVQAVRGTRTMVGMLPTGMGPSGQRDRLGSLYYSVAAADEPVLRRSSLAAWKVHVHDVLPEADPLLEQIRSWDDLVLGRYHDVVMPTWHDRGVVILGDAAHATSPQLGQGCNLALVDAGVLADCIAAAPDLSSALRAYSRARTPTLGFYQRATRWLTPLFQSDDDLLGFLRDLAFPIAVRLPFVEKRMLEAMAGTATGWLSADPLPPL